MLSYIRKFFPLKALEFFLTKEIDGLSLLKMGLVNEMTTGRELRSLIDKRVSGLASRKLNSFYANYFLRKQKT